MFQSSINNGLSEEEAIRQALCLSMNQPPPPHRQQQHRRSRRQVSTTRSSSITTPSSSATTTPSAAATTRRPVRPTITLDESSLTLSFTQGLIPMIMFILFTYTSYNNHKLKAIPFGIVLISYCYHHFKLRFGIIYLVTMNKEFYRSITWHLNTVGIIMSKSAHNLVQNKSFTHMLVNNGEAAEGLDHVHSMNRINSMDHMNSVDSWEVYEEFKEMYEINTNNDETSSSLPSSSRASSSLLSPSSSKLLSSEEEAYNHHHVLSYLFVNHFPPGSFVYDFWYVVVLASIIFLISFFSLVVTHRHKLYQLENWFNLKFTVYVLPLITRASFLTRRYLFSQSILNAYLLFYISCICYQHGMKHLQLCSTLETWLVPSSSSPSSVQNDEKSDDDMNNIIATTTLTPTTAACSSYQHLFWLFFTSYSVCFGMWLALKVIGIRMKIPFWSALINSPYMMMKQLMDLIMNGMLRVGRSSLIFMIDCIDSTSKIVSESINGLNRHLLKPLILKLYQTIIHFLKGIKGLMTMIYDKILNPTLNWFCSSSSQMKTFLIHIISHIYDGYLFPAYRSMCQHLKTLITHVMKPIGLKLYHVMKNIIRSSYHHLTSSFCFFWKSIQKISTTIISPFVSKVYQWTFATGNNLTFYFYSLVQNMKRVVFNTYHFLSPRLSTMVNYLTHVIVVKLFNAFKWYYWAYCHPFIRSVFAISSRFHHMTIDSCCLFYHFMNEKLQLFGDWISNLIFIRIVSSFNSLYYKLINVLSRAYQTFYELLTRIYLPFRRSLNLMTNWMINILVKYLINGFIVHFTRAWWRLIPAILSVKTCYLFLSIPITSYYHYYHYYSFQSSSHYNNSKHEEYQGTSGSSSGLDDDDGDVLAVVVDKPVFSAMLGYCLAAWSVGILSFILLKDVYIRTFRWSNLTNRQYIATSRNSNYYNRNSPVDVMLEHVDIGLVEFAFKTGLKLYHFIRYVGNNLLNWIFKLFRFCIQIVRYLWCKLIKPILNQCKQMILTIWFSPILCSSSTFLLLTLLFAHHQHVYKWHKTEDAILFLHQQSLKVILNLKSMIYIYVPILSRFLLTKISLFINILHHICQQTKEQMISAMDNQNVVESPRLAYVVWLVIVFATKATDEIRIKTLNWPFLILWMTAACGGSQYLTHVLFGVLLWCGVGVLVRRYEERERERIAQTRQTQANVRSTVSSRQERHETTPGQLHHQPPPPLARSSPPVLTTIPTTAVGQQARSIKLQALSRSKVMYEDQTECPICLDELLCMPCHSTGNGAMKDRTDGDDGGGEIAMLPCAHRFHAKCINEWLERESRCPLCRQAAHGIDRVLEIVF